MTFQRTLAVDLDQPTRAVFLSAPWQILIWGASILGEPGVDRTPAGEAAHQRQHTNQPGPAKIAMQEKQQAQQSHAYGNTDRPIDQTNIRNHPASSPQVASHTVHILLQFAGGGLIAVKQKHSGAAAGG